jgi:hypothetical protein
LDVEEARRRALGSLHRPLAASVVAAVGRRPARDDDDDDGDQNPSLLMLMRGLMRAKP